MKSNKKNLSPTIVVFDDLANEYDQWFDHHPAVFQSELAALKKITPIIGDSLEVGVGSGRFAAALGIPNGVEPSAAMRTIAESRGIKVFSGFSESLPFLSNHFDFVLFVTTICFVDNIVKTLKEAYRVLKNHGALIIGMIDRDSNLGRSYEAHKQQNPYYRYAHFYSTKEILQFLTENGFETKETYQTIFSPLENIKSIEPVKKGYGEGGFVVIKANKSNL